MAEVKSSHGAPHLARTFAMNSSRRATTPVFVFVHGFLGFEKISLPFLSIEYFRGVRALMRDLGLPFAFARLPASGAVAERAGALDRFLRDLDAGEYVLVGYSMGGLDGRYLLHHFATGDRVRALVTVGTPHRGSPVATRILSGNPAILRIARSLLGGGIGNLTPDFCRRFNEETTDVRNAHRLSYGGQRSPAQLPAWWRPLAEVIERSDGANDGLVSVKSAQWGDYRGTVPADHAELIGWSLAGRNPEIARPFPHLDFYRRLIGDAARLLEFELPR